MTVFPEATLRFKVTSAQGFFTLPLGGVVVDVAGHVGVTNDVGDATVTVRLPLPAGARAFVGGNRDVAPFLDRSFKRTLVALPSGLVHGSDVSLAASVLEGCAIDSVGFEGGDLINSCRHYFTGLPFAHGAGALLAPGTATPLADDAPFTVRVHAMTEGRFDDPSAVVAFPPLRTSDGQLLRCDELFDIEIDDAEINPLDPTGFTVEPNIAVSDNPGASMFYFDEDAGGFVEDPTAVSGESLRLNRKGTWCFGAAQDATSCVLVSVSTDTRVTEDVDVELFWDSNGVGRNTVRIPVGGSVCADVFVGSFVQALSITSDGRRGEGNTFTEVENLDACGSPVGCFELIMAFDAAPSDGCVDIETFVEDIDPNTSEILSLGLPTVPIAVLEPRENTFYRGRLDLNAAAPRRCLLMPRRVERLIYFYPELDAHCGREVFSSEFRFAFRDQLPLDDDDVCGEGTCEQGLGLADFFCGS